MDWHHEVERLIDQHATESRTLEFKRELNLATAAQRVECMKDLTAMGNSGGGLVVFGVAESARADGVGVAADIVPIENRGLVPRLHDALRDSVFPPLLIELHEVDVDDGFVLVAEVFASPLGPYMVEAGQHRYYTRAGTSNAPMTEQQVRDAYALAERRASRREDVWTSHGMPLRVEHGPWLSVSLVPHEPLLSRFRSAEVTAEDVRVPESLRPIANREGLVAVHDSLGRWASGLFGYDGPSVANPRTAIRIHEDGSLACGRRLSDVTTIDAIVFALDAMVAWAAFMLNCLGVPTAVELELHVDRASQIQLDTIVGGAVTQRQHIHQPVGLLVVDLSARSEHRPRCLHDARTRHAVVREMADCVSSAFGVARPRLGFEFGALFGADGMPTRYAVAGNRLYGDRGHDVFLHADGALIVSHNNQLLGYLMGGAIVDAVGDTLAVTEWATGHGCPPDFLPQASSPNLDEIVPATPLGTPSPSQLPTELPVPTSRWAPDTFGNRLAAVRSATLSACLRDPQLICGVGTGHGVAWQRRARPGAHDPREGFGSAPSVNADLAHRRRRRGSASETQSPTGQRRWEMDGRGESR